ncbi:hypothetical protein BC941DRAFT_444023 [Chlamydoabsidia padenii]|nr:hypothetical protein BC941DRAFT_444023 [Chlamydoabsidia padenii]
MPIHNNENLMDSSLDSKHPAQDECSNQSPSQHPGGLAHLASQNLVSPLGFKLIIRKKKSPQLNYPTPMINCNQGQNPMVPNLVNKCPTDKSEVPVSGLFGEILQPQCLRPTQVITQSSTWTVPDKMPSTRVINRRRRPTIVEPSCITNKCHFKKNCVVKTHVDLMSLARSSNYTPLAHLDTRLHGKRPLQSIFENGGETSYSLTSRKRPCPVSPSDFPATASALAASSSSRPVVASSSSVASPNHNQHQHQQHYHHQQHQHQYHSSSPPS